MRIVARATGLLIAACALSASAVGFAGAQPDAGSVTELRLSGVVDPFVANYVRGGIEDAERDGAAAVLLTIDTPGGLDSSMREIIQAILGARIPVICYVSPEGARAASAGTFVLISCPVAAMAPGTNVGAAHPVGLSGAIESEKATNDAAAYIRSLAQQRGRNADWAERAVREAVSASAEEALDLGVIDLIAPNVASLLADLSGRTVEVAGGQQVTLDLAGATVDEHPIGFFTGFLHTLLNPNLAFIFFWLGLALIVLEIFVPGGIAGTIGGILFVLSIVAIGMLPVQLVGVVFLIASVVFFVLELKHPGIGVPSIGAVIALVLGGLFLFDPSVPSARVSPWVIAPVAAFVAFFSLVVLRAAMRMRHRPVTTGVHRLIGREGRAQSALDPKGVVLVGAEEWSAESAGEAIPRGERVRVVGVDGLRLKVEPIQEEAPASPGALEGRAT